MGPWNEAKGMSGKSAEVAFWSATRHLVNRAMAEAGDSETQRAYIVVLEHAEKSLDRSLTERRGGARKAKS
jgi:hypothetical protein